MDKPTRATAPATPPVAPSGCTQLLAEAAELWLSVHGAPASWASGDAHFTHLAERVLWHTAKTLGYAP